MIAKQQTIHPIAGAAQGTAVTKLSPPPPHEWPWRARLLIALALILLPVCGLALIIRPQDGEDRRPAYGRAAAHDAVTRLQSRINSGAAVLRYDSKTGYLPAVLKELHVPAASQMLVFSKTSVQKELISPEKPRALYFGDNAYVGYLPEAKALEVVTMDPQLGPIYYVLLQKQTEKPVFFRAVEVCLECHATKETRYVPQHLMRSVYADAQGAPIPGAPSYETTDATPQNERWGGWYVTGRHGSQRHMGNVFATARGDAVTLDREKGANITDLHGLVDTSPYLTPYSDIVALMVMAHQTHLQNLIVQANYQTNAMLRSQSAASPGTMLSANRRDDVTPGRIREACEPLVRAMLFVGEAPLTAPVTGVSRFAEEFAAGGPRSRKNRSLREFDLKRRLFRYPCSYTIYSEAFDALPVPAKAYIYRRLREVLSGQDRSKAFAHLSVADRGAIWDILSETKPGFSAKAVGR